MHFYVMGGNIHKEKCHLTKLLPNMYLMHSSRILTNKSYSFLFQSEFCIKTILFNFSLHLLRMHVSNHVKSKCATLIVALFCIAQVLLQDTLGLRIHFYILNDQYYNFFYG